MRRAVVYSSFLLTLWACDCGDDPVGLDGSPTTDGSSSTDGAVLTDGAPAGDSGGPGADGGGRPGDGCPLYHQRCGTTCIPITVDPDNCGGCGVVCTSSQACSGGQCADTCIGSLTICDRECVDTGSDNRHCGGCNTPCATGTGCTGGTCVTSVDLDPRPTDCAPNEPMIPLPGGQSTCGGGLAEINFRWGLCSCDRVSTSSDVFIDAYDSLSAPYVPGGPGGGLGLNGRLSSSGTIDVTGSLWVADAMGISMSRPLEVDLELRSAGRIQSSQSGSVGLDGFVNGDVDTNGMDFAGTLHVPAGSQVTGTTYGALVEEPVTVANPCDCEEAQLVPVGEIVVLAESDNDNALIGLDPTVLDNPAEPQRLDLPCGAYYLTELSGSRPITIMAHGRVALFIAGDISVSQNLVIGLVPGASLDVFIAGRISSSGDIRLGSPAYPALMRFYVGSTDGIGISSTLDVGAFLWVGHGRVSASSDIELFGGLFAGEYQSSGETFIHYDRAVLQAGDECRPPRDRQPPPDGGPPPPDAGGPPPMQCEDCRDCGNQACVGGTCGECTTSDECCAPLLCINGECINNPF